MLIFTPEGTSESWTMFNVDGEGGPYLGATPRTEELSTPGVNGRRYREVHLLHEPWERVCFWATASYALALDSLIAVERFSGQVGTLVIIGPNNDTRRVKSLAEKLEAKPMAAPIILPTGVFAAYVRSVWRFTSVEDPT